MATIQFNEVTKQFDDVVVSGIDGRLDDVDVASPYVLEQADEDRALGEAHRLRGRRLDAELRADRAAEPAATRAADDDGLVGRTAA